MWDDAVVRDFVGDDSPSGIPVRGDAAGARSGLFFLSVLRLQRKPDQTVVPMAVECADACRGGGAVDVRLG